MLNLAVDKSHLLPTLARGCHECGANFLTWPLAFVSVTPFRCSPGLWGLAIESPVLVHVLASASPGCCHRLAAGPASAIRSPS